MAVTMPQRFFLLLLATLCGALSAGDIGVAAPDGMGGWVLLEDPFGESGTGLSEHAGDPGLPVPDALGWPHAGGDADGHYPTTELWFYDAIARDWRRATHVLGKGDETRRGYRRTLHEPFTIDGAPYVLHFDPYQGLGGYTQVVKVDDTLADAGGMLPGSAIVLNSKQFLDAPAVSPDGRHVALRAYARGENGFNITLRVYATADWTMVAESDVQTFGRPVWVDDSTLASVSFDADALPDTPQRDAGSRFFVKVRESHDPRPGRLLTLEINDGKLENTVILDGAFPPDNYTRSVGRDPFGPGLVVARKQGDSVVVELREPAPDGEVETVAEYESFRGFSVSADVVRAMGVVKENVESVLYVHELLRDDERELREVPLRHFSVAGHGGLVDFGHGVSAMIEPVVNPDFAPGADKPTQMLRHTLNVISWPGCDTMRNPRALAYLSKLVRRFDDVGTIRSSLLVFDLDITSGANDKSGRYIELYGASGRGGKGRLRMEDNLGGSWLVQAIDGNGTKEGDTYYAENDVRNPANDGTPMAGKPAINAGKVYDDLVTQLETRKLLMLNGVEKSVGSGGLRYLGRRSYRDPASGVTWRTWVYEKFGRILDPEKQQQLKEQLSEARGRLDKAEGEDKERLTQEVAALEQALATQPRERIEIRFVADLPVGSAGDWKFPHAIANVKMRFAVAGARNAAVTDLAFDPTKWVSLPNLTDLKSDKKTRRPDLLLPGLFRIYQPDENGKPEKQLEARAVAEEFNHPVRLAKDGKLRAGYDVPLVNFGNRQFINLKR